MDGTALGVLIALGLGIWVGADASTLKQRQIAEQGQSTLNPVLWGIGTFLLAIVFGPLYLVTRSNIVRTLAPVSPVYSAPPASQAPLQPAVHIPAGWLADPTGQHELRYWNGVAWTDHTYDAVPPPTGGQPTP